MIRVLYRHTRPGDFEPVTTYQLALVTPGISPRRANSRKHMRQIPNFRIYARLRPHLKQRLYARVLNFGLRCCFTISAFRAKELILSSCIDVFFNL